MRLIPVVFLLGWLLAACSSARTTAPASAPDRLSALQEAMTGSFSSAAQASTDESYYDIDLHMQPVWTDRPGHYLYVEQAVADSPREPYRQRVYKLERKGRKLISRVYELPEPQRFVGAHRRPALLDVIGPDDLTERTGCAVVLREESPGLYRGSTRKKRCKSSLRGATYATSRVSIAGGRWVQSWDRGFNDDDEQVWGATEGGYMFFRE